MKHQQNLILKEIPSQNIHEKKSQGSSDGYIKLIFIFQKSRISFFFFFCTNIYIYIYIYIYTQGVPKKCIHITKSATVAVFTLLK